MTVTVSSLITEVATIVSDTAPDLTIYIGAGVVVALGVMLFRRFVRGAR